MKLKEWQLPINNVKCMEAWIVIFPFLNVQHRHALQCLVYLKAKLCCHATDRRIEWFPYRSVKLLNLVNKVGTVWSCSIKNTLHPVLWLPAYRTEQILSLWGCCGVLGPRQWTDYENVKNLWATVIQLISGNFSL